MTAFEAQRAMKDTLAVLFENVQFCNETGELSNVNFYLQDLPVQQDDVDDISTVPYQIVRLVDGAQQTWDGNHAVDLIVIICVFDNGDGQAGYQDVMHQIDMILDRFSRNHYFGAVSLPADAAPTPAYKKRWRFEVAENIQWAVDDADAWPYYLGAVKLTVNCPGRREEDDLA